MIFTYVTLAIGALVMVHFPQMYILFWGVGGWLEGGVKMLGSEVRVLSDRFFRTDSQSGVVFEFRQPDGET